MTATVKMLPPGPIQTERLPDGRRRLIRPLRLSIGGELVLIPEGFVTDFSSWPRWLPGPAMHRMDVAGIVHDYLFQYGRLGLGGRKIGYVESNQAWFAVARGGQEVASAGWFWGWCGRLGLFVGSWPIWLKYRRRDEVLDAEESPD